MINNKISLNTAEFLTSSTTEVMPEGNSEVVFMGRSNVGKSSLLNSLTNRRKLAKKSQTPGKTQTINFFDIGYNDSEKNEYKCIFVDLPGIGYAKVSKTLKEGWSKFLNSYINSRVSIRIFIYLIDSRHPELEIDKQVQADIQKMLKPDQAFFKVYTKIDKLGQSEKSKLPMGEDILFVSNASKFCISKLNERIFSHLFKLPSEVLAQAPKE